MREKSSDGQHRVIAIRQGRIPLVATFERLLVFAVIESRLQGFDMALPATEEWRHSNDKGPVII
ncbi:hypothetical protein [Bifidobacterium vespertilionis]|uniref:Uncharacterized protein n=1 Tax=Bifidobacterium vespertilionis TaxID=2562524 RepID=A0A5J5E0L8_9BIFI|nr:hypothetical protein [Bifidobacterium vespertilionis]KAA8821277.1 hypothetical protein EM848_11070 [Bifidobacterium vespertilionis]KAA8822512.1 hypothetical protein EMO90_00510 [Bifidobacterium vespertilionis]